MPASLYSAHLQMSDPHRYPGDPWLVALEADGRMAPSAIGIVYADSMRSLSEEYAPPQVAKWHCWECSDRHNKLYMLCDACSGSRKHEEHYQVEWVY